MIEILKLEVRKQGKRKWLEPGNISEPAINLSLTVFMK
jgi:hypothetical protein